MITKLVHDKVFSGKGHRAEAKAAEDSFRQSGYFVEVRRFNTPVAHVTVKAYSQDEA